MRFRRLLTPALFALSLISVTSRRAVAQQSNNIFQGKKVLMVAANKGDGAATDQAIKKHFESLGMSVNMVPDQNLPSADGYDLIFLASDIPAKTVTSAFRDTKVPVFTEKPWLLDFLGMTYYQPQKDYGEDIKVEQSFLWLVNAPNPIQAGFPNGMFMPTKHAIKEYEWGLPTPSAQVIAFLPGEPNKAVLFAYEKGVYMEGEFTAPARRIFFGLAPDGFENLIPDGVKLFDSCAAWALGGK